MHARHVTWDRRLPATAALLWLLAAVLPSASAAQSMAEIEAALDLYRVRLVNTGLRVSAYPEEALAQRLEGVAAAEVTVAADGRLHTATLFQSSGHAVLDAHAVQLLERAVPLTEIPSTLQNKAFAVRVAIAFRLPE